MRSLFGHREECDQVLGERQGELIVRFNLVKRTTLIFCNAQLNKDCMTSIPNDLRMDSKMDSTVKEIWIYAL